MYVGLNLLYVEEKQQHLLDPLASRMSLADPTDRYRRMRNLNNEASRRCRQNRNKKFNDLLEELKVQEARNEDLKMKYNLLVEAKDQAKKMFLEMIAQGARSQM